MQEYKTSYAQMREIFELIIDGWDIDDVCETQGYMRIKLQNENQTEYKEFDMNAI